MCKGCQKGAGLVVARIVSVIYCLHIVIILKASNDNYSVQLSNINEQIVVVKDSCRLQALRLTTKAKQISQLLWTKNDSIIQTVTQQNSVKIIIDGSSTENYKQSLRFPSAVTVFGKQIMIADFFQHRIQQLNTDGTSVETFWGSSGQGNSIAQLNYPIHIHHSSKGNLYITDEENQRVLQIDHDKKIRVVAGGNGRGEASFQFKGPSSSFVNEENGHIFVCDMYNNRVQRWNMVTKKVVTVAGGNGKGNAANQLQNPAGIFVDAEENVYVADAGNNRIMLWKKGANSGIVVAGGNGKGNAPNQLRDPRSVFVNEEGDMYIADVCNHRIQYWKTGADKGITVAGGNGQGNDISQLNYPRDVFVDAEKNVYIADQYNHRIVKKNFSNDSVFLLPINSPGTYAAIITYSDGSIEEKKIVVEAHHLISSATQLADSIKKNIPSVLLHTQTKTLLKHNFVWKSSDTSILQVLGDSILFPRYPGKAKLISRVQTAKGCVDSFTIDQIIKPLPPVVKDSIYIVKNVNDTKNVQEQIISLQGAVTHYYTTQMGEKEIQPVISAQGDTSFIFWVDQQVAGINSDRIKFKASIRIEKPTLKLYQPFGKTIKQLPKNKPSIRVFPNPFIDQIHISTSQPQELLDVMVHDLTGKKMGAYRLCGQGTITTSGNFTAGYYIITVRSKEFTSVVQVLCSGKR